jgi:hypothetical protein
MVCINPTNKITLLHIRLSFTATRHRKATHSNNGTAHLQGSGRRIGHKGMILHMSRKCLTFLSFAVTVLEATNLLHRKHLGTKIWQDILTRAWTRVFEVSQCLRGDPSRVWRYPEARAVQTRRPCINRHAISRWRFALSRCV